MGDELRVWLEPDYDHGRTGAWLLDWPGAFAWGSDREAALARASSAAHRFAEWLADHGEEVQPGLPAVSELSIVEEVAAYTLDDGYEVNATFGDDRRAVSRDEVETHIRRLGYARQDLLALMVRLEEFAAGGGKLPPEVRSEEALATGASPGREAAEVLRHLAAAEAWFVSRLDGSARYAGPPRDGDLAAYLDGTRTWLVEALRRFVADDPALSRTDGKGEEWTLAKLLRRTLYHSLDHFDELDRRLALAENRAGRLELRRNAEVDIEQLLVLLDGAGLRARARLGHERVARMLAGSTETVSLWDGERLVAFGRIISDETTNAYIGTVAVAPRWQDRGAGTRLMRALMEGREALKLVLDARSGSERFYERLGFEPGRSLYVRPRP
jgi:ribosomal protein S18 acetylase RimI-like enzyme